MQRHVSLKHQSIKSEQECIFNGKMRYPCKHCPKSFSRKFNMQRHLSLRHPTIKPSKDISYKKKWSADKRGIDYECDVETCMDTEEPKGDDKSGVEAENGDDNERVWMFIVKSGLQKHADILTIKCDNYKKKGMTPETARRFASEDIFHLYKADVKQSYKHIVTAMHALEKSKHHKKIMGDVYKFIDRGDVYEKAIVLSLRINDKLLNEIIDDIIDGLNLG